ncbi:zinc finger protein 516-like [Scleropages formosus]|uniref:Zinc finger protein 516-like n=1 Tax=Scleropages formosus TaxID=113540 RepID=A0A0N8K2Y1_SCLFO|nr:zinc finger protein 516-like [Scleropages formosus]
MGEAHGEEVCRRNEHVLVDRTAAVNGRSVPEYGWLPVTQLWSHNRNPSTEFSNISPSPPLCCDTSSQNEQSHGSLQIASSPAVAMNPGEAETEKLEASVDKSKMKGGRADQDKSLCYACNICGKSFPFQSSLSQHMRKHTGERPYKCPYCEHRASQKGSLKLHIRGHKLGTLSHGFEEADGELAEAGVSEGLGACASPTESTSACNGVLHDGAKDDDGDKVPAKGAKRDRAALRCALCKRKLGSREELERHAQLHKPYRCRLCSFVVMREDQLLCHIEKMHITVEAAVPEAVDGEAGPDGQSEGPFPCKLCDKVFGQAWLLKAHTKKHLASTEHCCHVCGRRFREAWFLRSHMKTHGSKAGGRGKAKGDSEPAATINDVVQDETAMVNGLCLFEICSRCGNLFHDQESLQVHERVHTHAHRINGKRPHSRRKSSDDLDSSSAKKLFMEGLNLRPAAAKDSPMEEMLGKRIPELDPVCSYQAWQLTTKGRVAEVSDAGRYLGWDEVLEDADVAYDEEKESMSDAEYRPPSRQSRRASQSKSAECFECGRVFRTHHQMVLHSRMHRKDARSGGESRGQGERLGSASEAESGSASRPSTPGCEDSPPFVVGEDTAGDASLDKKPYICNRCNVVTTDLSSWLSHVKLYHKEQGGEPSSSRPNQIEPKSTEGEGAGSLPAGAGEGTEFPKLKKALLQEPPVPSSPRGGAAGSAAEMQNGTRTRGKVDSVPLNLTLQAGSQTAGVGSRLQGSMVTHQCTSCPFVTRYPEVLWIHQLPGSSRKSRSVESSSSSSNRDSSSVSRAPPSKSPLHPAKKHKASKHSAEEGMQSRPRLEPHPTADSAAAPEKSAAGCPRRTGSPKGSSQLERFSLPREGLGFMLSSKHALSENARGATLSSHPLPGRTHNQQETHGPRHGADPRAAPGSGAAWSRSSALLDAPPFLTQVTKEPSTDIAEPPGGIFGFLKSCNSHGLTNLYQRWGGLTGSALDHTDRLSQADRSAVHRAPKGHPSPGVFRKANRQQMPPPAGRVGW